jgi:hypothetical protein
MTDTDQEAREIQYINLKLAAGGRRHTGEFRVICLEVAWPLLQNHQEKSRLLAGHLCPADRRIQNFLDAYLRRIAGGGPRFCSELDLYPGPSGFGQDAFPSAGQRSFPLRIVTTYRVKQGILHNPKSDRRTTAGVFHVAEGGFPVPWDKKSVPKGVFRSLLAAAVIPPTILKFFPLPQAQAEQGAGVGVIAPLARWFAPKFRAIGSEKRLEIRFFAPGSMVGNLDFLGTYFGNAGDPSLPANDASLGRRRVDRTHGVRDFGPHLVTLKKKDLGLPPALRPPIAKKETACVGKSGRTL